ncbi:hypothetical protein BDN72DRAFT_849123 [Pluteus cervinus]|uniref:Uncharacterized protein n=1 Tax=Pluteus cervinus TaxID=181527 RepID=A0ACD3A9F9_9AGAR|nr:hypothetical protein BDN72DRAFT_849123 [Pluteus cervinus]
MSKFLASKTGKKVLTSQLSGYVPPDPYYETVIDPQSHKSRRRPRPSSSLPKGLSKHDLKILLKLQKRAHRLDTGINLCGIRFGYTFFIGLVPVLGDFVDFYLNYALIVRKAQKELDIPEWLVWRMKANNLVSVGVGAVPVVGDVVLAIWKANSRNVALLEGYLRERGEEYLRLSGEGEGVVKFGVGGVLVEEEGQEDGEGHVEGSEGTGTGTAGPSTASGSKKKNKKSNYVDKKHLRPGHGLKKGEVIPGSELPPAATQPIAMSSSKGPKWRLFGSGSGPKKTGTEIAHNDIPMEQTN